MKIKINDKVVNKTILYILILLPFFEPRMVSIVSDPLHKVYLLLLCFVCLFTSICILNKNFMRGHKKSRVKFANMKNVYGFLLAMLAYKAISILSMIVNRKATFLGILDCISLFLMVTYILLETKDESEGDKLLRAFYIVLNSITIISIVCQFIFPNGFGYDATGNIIYFWNTRNHMLTLFLVTLLVNIEYGHLISGVFRLLQNIIQIIIIADIVYLWSATALIGVGLFVGLVILIRLKVKPVTAFLRHPLIVALVGLAFNFGIVVLRLQNYFEYIIVTVLHRDLTFSYRTTIWDAAIMKILQRFWIGYGEDTVIDFTMRSQNLKLMPHNQFLDILILYGFFAFICFMIMMLFFIRQVSSLESEKQKLELSAVLLTITICCVTEKLSPVEPLYIFFCLAWVLPQISEIQQKKVKIKIF